MAEKVTLNSTTKKVKPKSVTTTNDYTIPEEVIENEKKGLAPQYGLNPDGTENEARLKSLLFDPEKVQKEKEREAKEAKLQRWFANAGQALGLITDIATAKAGGNVVIRPKDNTASVAGEKEETLRKEIDNLPTMYRKGVEGLRQAYQKAVNDRIDKLRPMYKTQNKEYEYENVEEKSTRDKAFADKRTGGGTGGGNSKLVQYNFNIGDKVVTIDLPKYVGESFAGNISSRLGAVLNDGQHQALRDQLIAQGVIKITKDERNNVKKEEFDLSRLISSGIGFDDPSIQGVIEQVARIGLDGGQLTQAQYNSIIADMQRLSTSADVQPEQKAGIFARIGNMLGFGGSTTTTPSPTPSQQATYVTTSGRNRLATTTTNPRSAR